MSRPNPVHSNGADFCSSEQTLSYPRTLPSQDLLTSPKPDFIYGICMNTFRLSDIPSNPIETLRPQEKGSRLSFPFEKLLAITTAVQQSLMLCGGHIVLLPMVLVERKSSREGVCSCQNQVAGGLTTMHYGLRTALELLPNECPKGIVFGWVNVGNLWELWTMSESEEDTVCTLS